jgi:hypothetical protein
VGELRKELLKNTILWVSLVLAILATPWVTGQGWGTASAGGDPTRITVQLTITVLLYAVLLGVAYVLRSNRIVRRMFDRNAVLEGWYVSCHLDTGDRFFGIFRIHYSRKRQAWRLEGTTIDTADPQPSGRWFSDSIRFDPDRREVAYIYFGRGTDSAPGKDAVRDVPGLAVLEFEDMSFCRGRGYFQEVAPTARLRKTRFRRVAKAEILERTQKRSLDDFGAMRSFIAAERGAGPGGPGGKTSA